jgi:hypothetical protein
MEIFRKEDPPGGVLVGVRTLFERLLTMKLVRKLRFRQVARPVVP